MKIIRGANKLYKLKYIIFIFYLSFISCGSNSLGGGEEMYLPIDRNELNLAIDSLYKLYPKYCMPKKWEHLDDWQKLGYGFLDGKIFYFSSKPEEMYYVTILGDLPTKVRAESWICVRAMSKGNPANDDDHWSIAKNISKKEMKRIDKRFYDEIVVKLYDISGLGKPQIDIPRR